VRALARVCEVGLLASDLGIPHSDWPEAARRAALAVQALPGRRLVFGGLREARAGDVLQALAVALRAEWRPVQTAWVLTDRPGLEEWVLLRLLDHPPGSREASLTVQTLAPAQLARLRATGGLGPAELTPLQRRALQFLVTYDYVRYGDVAPEALRLEGVSLRLQEGLARIAPQLPDVNVVVPGLGSPLDYRRAFDGRMVERLAADPPRPLPRPPALPRNCDPVLPGAARPADLSAPHLAAPVRAAPSTVMDAVQLVAGNGVSALCSTGLHSHPLPPAGPTATLADLLRAVEQATAGTWKQVGSVYCLAPDPLVEELKRRQGESQHLGEAAALRLARSLTTRQRDRLRRAGSLPPSALDERQRKTLRLIAAVGFVRYPWLSRDGLDLRDVSLFYLPPEQGNGLPARVGYRFPTVVPLPDGELTMQSFAAPLP